MPLAVLCAGDSALELGAQFKWAPKRVPVPTAVLSVAMYMCVHAPKT